jgi:acyl-CoA synthetase (AMP-forming)/AMP-acid ligase II
VSGTTARPSTFRPATYAATHPDRAAVITGAGLTVTYQQLEARSARLAQALHAHGLRPGDNVAVVLPNDHRTHEIVWALQRSGLYYTMVNSHLTAEEAAYIVNDCGASVLVTSTSLGDLPAALVPLSPGIDLRLIARGDRASDGVDGVDAVAAVPAITSHVDLDTFTAPHPPTPRAKGLEGSPLG